MSKVAEFTIPVQTKNYSNGPQGVSRGAMFARAKAKAEQRDLTRLVLSSARKRLVALLETHKGFVITLTRIAPSEGLDPDDNLPSALKWVKDGIAKVLGLPSDRTPLISWRYDQRRGGQGVYAVHVLIELRRALVTT